MPSQPSSGGAAGAAVGAGASAGGVRVGSLVLCEPCVAGSSASVQRGLHAGEQFAVCVAVIVLDVLFGLPPDLASEGLVLLLTAGLGGGNSVLRHFSHGGGSFHAAVRQFVWLGLAGVVRSHCLLLVLVYSRI